MQRYIIVRGFHALITLFAISIIIFALTRATGDPTDVMLPPEATIDEVQRLRDYWRLDDPLHIQYLIYVGNVFSGNLGESVKWPGKTAGELILQRMPATIKLTVVAMVVSVSLALPLGILTAVKKDTFWDVGGKIFALLGQAVPNFWLGIMMVWILAVHWDLFPTSGKGDGGWDGIHHLILPAFALGAFNLAAGLRLSRSAMLDVLDSEYVKMARVKGLPEWIIIWKHCLRNAALVPLTYFGIQFAGLITGSVITETVFAYPGVGLLAIEAIRSRDFQVVQSVVVVFAFIYVLVALLVDILYAYLDPRIRLT
ncbi:MAG: ABC transporter permease [Chloroflexota bacterium]|nr:ABC transporter permease [Chloroflexota bacterium]